jgi:putative nucleotidyltransferase with HDIG domain
MSNKASDTQSIKKNYLIMNSLLVKVVSKLSLIDNPVITEALRDLKTLGESLDSMQDGMGTFLQTGKHQFSAMAEIGHMMNSALGLNQVLEGAMDAVIKLVDAERGFLMLREADGTLTIQVARGMDHADLEKEIFAVSRTIVQQVANSGEPVLSLDARQDPRFGKEVSVISLNLRSILSAPLRLKGQVIGVIFLDNRAQTGLFDKSDLEMLSAFADQAAIAIDNARMFESLQKANRELETANQELKIAYDATLKGWVRALDLRDQETNGHTQRVTSLARVLGRAVGLDGDDLVDITRGALVHDIGKMGTPDSILLKPGSLTPDEWAIMQQHTVLAYEMLRPIQFLRRAIDVPYCHHERWDGSGYPRGLKGQDIPLLARIFSIVDVWDAVTSIRPYHNPMTADDARLLIAKQAGTYFDPNIVEIFLNLKDLPGAILAEQKQLQL